MRIWIINFFKKHESLLKISNFFLRCFFNFIGLFIKTKENKIIFTSFGGRKFDDSPKALFDRINEDHFFDDYEKVWAFVNPDDFKNLNCKTIKIDTFNFFVELLSSKIWISNTDIDRGIGIHKRGCIRIETWHGTPLKRICGEETAYNGKKQALKHKRNGDTIQCAQSTYDRDIFSRIFKIPKESFLLCDLPRNDELVFPKSFDRNKILKLLGIKENDSRKIILYMPTYREYLINEHNQNFINLPINIDKWIEKLGDKYIILFRAHYAVNKTLGITDGDTIKDVSNYGHLNDLYLVSDMLISDYSSSFFDYSILKKPMFCFAYDLEEYVEKRGLYMNIEELPCKINRNEDELIDDILQSDMNVKKKQTILFANKFAPNPGKASLKIIDELKLRLSKK